MNLELIATEIGESVKYTTTVNQINRVAKPIFKFPLDILHLHGKENRNP